jgi:hypothetical protein
MPFYVRLCCVVAFVLSAVIVNAQEVPGEPTSATDHKVRIHKAKRINTDEEVSERHGQSLRKRKAAGGSGSAKETKVYKRHRHFADKDIKLRSRSKIVRKESLGVGTE